MIENIMKKTQKKCGKSTLKSTEKTTRKAYSMKLLHLLELIMKELEMHLAVTALQTKRV